MVNLNMVNSYFHLFQRESLLTKDFQLTVPDLYSQEIVLFVMCVNTLSFSSGQSAENQTVEFSLNSVIFC